MRSELHCVRLICC